ncbi:MULTISPECIES: hypothetical protein [Helicobacter]|uniref:hypothetical protein n=1 Tax=Helicobacter TaxID=209 RepID=UPI00262AB9D8|nr:hypothetical protein [Helicobacter sp. UBA3407]
MQISGFSVAKKGGGGTEVFYRSQGAGRLPIFVNGSNLNSTLFKENLYFSSSSSWLLSGNFEIYAQLESHLPALLANKPLAQVAPLSSRIALKYDDQKIFLKCEMYANAKQTRSDEGYGNVIGKDFGDSSGLESSTSMQDCAIKNGKFNGARKYYQ